MPEGRPIPIGVTISRERAEGIIESAFDAAADAQNRDDFEEVGRQAAVIGEVSYAIRYATREAEGRMAPNWEKPKRPLKLLIVGSCPPIDPVLVGQAVADADLVVDLRVGRVTKWREGSVSEFEMDWI